MTTFVKNSLDSLDVSVLIPVYFSDTSVGKVRWLRRALDSVSDQKFPGNVEILLVDDGSPSPVRELAEEFGPSAHDVRFIRTARNYGIVSALNAGLRQAKYPLVARLDADDAWAQGKIEKQLAMFASDADLALTATGMTRVDEADVVIDQHVRPGDWEGILRFFVEGGSPFPHGSVIARKDVYALLGGYPHDATFAHCEDYALWGTWIRFFKPAMLEESLYRYTVAQSSVSVVHGAQQATAARLVRDRFASLGLASRLPAALEELSRVVGISLVDAGALSYAMWRFGAHFVLPEAAIAPLGVILADRYVHVATSRQRARPLGGFFASAVAEHDDGVAVGASGSGGAL